MKNEISKEEIKIILSLKHSYEDNKKVIKEIYENVFIFIHFSYIKKNNLFIFFINSFFFLNELKNKNLKEFKEEDQKKKKKLKEEF